MNKEDNQTSDINSEIISKLNKNIEVHYNTAYDLYKEGKFKHSFIIFVYCLEEIAKLKIIRTYQQKLRLEANNKKPFINISKAKFGKRYDHKEKSVTIITQMLLSLVEDQINLQDFLIILKEHNCFEFKVIENLILLLGDIEKKRLAAIYVDEKKELEFEFDKEYMDNILPYIKKFYESRNSFSSIRSQPYSQIQNETNLLGRYQEYQDLEDDVKKLIETYIPKNI